MGTRDLCRDLDDADAYPVRQGVVASAGVLKEAGLAAAEVARDFASVARLVRQRPARYFPRRGYWRHSFHYLDRAHQIPLYHCRRHLDHSGRKLVALYFLRRGCWPRSLHYPDHAHQIPLYHCQFRLRPDHFVQKLARLLTAAPAS